jgi:hypothetical protein
MINIKPHKCLIRVTGSHELIFSGLESPRPQVTNGRISALLVHVLVADVQNNFDIF